MKQLKKLTQRLSAVKQRKRRVKIALRIVTSVTPLFKNNLDR